MSQIEAAEQRLDQAISRLEAAVRSLQHGSARENTRLLEQLAAMREEYDMVKQTAATVSGRLDSAIGKLQVVLEG